MLNHVLTSTNAQVSCSKLLLYSLYKVHLFSDMAGTGHQEPCAANARRERLLTHLIEIFN
jgi:hypothetical protein